MQWISLVVLICVLVPGVTMCIKVEKNLKISIIKLLVVKM